MTDINVVNRKIDDLIPYARNARTHPPEQIKQMEGSLVEFGWTNPILTDTRNGIVAGHARLTAARNLRDNKVATILGWPDKTVVPTIDLGHLTDSQRRAYVLADNRIALNGGWDNDILGLELKDLEDDGFDLEGLGFNRSELDGLLDHVEALELNTDPDDVPEPPVDPVTVFGDVWIMGRHRLMCGDSTSADDVAKLMNGASADLCFTSPPYGQQRDYKSGGISDWDALMQCVFGVLPVKHDAQVLVNLGMIHRESEWVPYWDSWIEWMRSAGWRRFGWYVWDQGPGMPGDWNGRLAPSHEFIFHFNRVAEKARKTKAKQKSTW